MKFALTKICYVNANFNILYFFVFFSSLLCKSNTSDKEKNVIYLEYKQFLQIITPNKLELSGLYTWRSNNLLNIYQK